MYRLLVLCETSLRLDLPELQNWMNYLRSDFMSGAKCHFFLFQTHYQHCHLLIISETNEGKNIFGQYIQIHNLSYIIYLWGGSSLTLLIVSCSCADRDLSWRLIASASCTWRNVISSWLGLLLCVLEKTTPTLLL